jgi:hypothetical protein
MVLMRANPLQGSLKGVGPENLTLLGPDMANSEASAICAQKGEDNSFCPGNHPHPLPSPPLQPFVQKNLEINSDM